MSYYKLMAFNMGQHKLGCETNCNPTCEHRKGDKCRLYSCLECGLFIEVGSPTVRVIFQATHKMESRRRYLYGRGINREPKEAIGFVTYHKDCYLAQLNRWLGVQFGKNQREGSNTNL